MQLVEQGKLDLNTDINKYLDFKIPDTYPEPITLTHVLTHTPGLEEDGRDLFTEDSTHIVPRSQWLPATHAASGPAARGSIPPIRIGRRRPRATIVERTSGKTWDEYIEQNILAPLGMNQTTGRQPLPGKYDGDMAKAYTWANGRWEAKPVRDHRQWRARGIDQRERQRHGEVHAGPHGQRVLQWRADPG
jgi:CubicO group peptidase (beta-lactamase class C family)